MGNVPHFEPGQTLVLRASRRKWTLVLLSCIAFVLLGVFILGSRPFYAWLVIVFFGLGCLVSIVSLVAPPTLTLDDDGFTMRGLWRSWRHAWTDVAEFGVSSVKVRGRTVRSVGICFAPWAKQGGWLRQLSKQMSGYDGGLQDTYGLSVEELAAFLDYVEWKRQRCATRSCCGGWRIWLCGKPGPQRYQDLRTVRNGSRVRLHRPGRTDHEVELNRRLLRLPNCDPRRV